MINYGLRNNLPSNTLYNSQVGTLIFCTCLVFKLSSLPGLIERNLHSSTLWFYLLMTAFEFVSFGLIYIFSRFGGDEFLTECKSKSYKAMLFVVMIYLAVKCILYFSFVMIFLTKELFISATPALFFVVMLIPVMYLGVKGARTIARTSEIFALLLFFGIIINLIFLKSDMDLGRNLPFLAVEPKEFLQNTMRYGLWLGDMFPLIFIKMQRKRLPYVGISVSIVAVIVNITVLLGVAMYGDSLSFVSNLLVEIAGFNQLSLEIGRMEWTALLVVVVMAIISMSFMFWGVTSCSERIFKNRKVMQIIFPLVLVTVLFAAPSMQAVADFALSEVGYAFFALAMGMPIILCVIFAIARKRHPKLTTDTPQSGDTETVNTEAINTENKEPAIKAPLPQNTEKQRVLRERSLDSATEATETMGGQSNDNAEVIA